MAWFGYHWGAEGIETAEVIIVDELRRAISQKVKQITLTFRPLVSKPHRGCSVRPEGPVSSEQDYIKS